MMFKLSFIGIFLLSFNLWANGVSTVESVMPTGAVKNIQQVKVRFSNEMVRMGDPRSFFDPFEVHCQQDIPSHIKKWIDSKTWSLLFDQALSPGKTCEIKFVPSTKDLYGNLVKSAERYRFSTSGPNIISVSPFYGQIHIDQHFVLELDSSVDENSMLNSIYFEVEDNPNKIRAKLVTSALRSEILKWAITHTWQWNSLRYLIEGKADLSNAKELERFVVIRAQRNFPESKKVVLHWPEGIKSKTGIANENSQNFTFQVAEPFTARFSCERSEASRPCNPISEMRIEFSRMISAKQLQQAYMLGPNSKKWKPEFYDNADEIYSLSFKGPFPEESQYKIYLPENIKDDMGRSLSNAKQFPLVVHTDTYLPLLKFAAPFGVIESEVEKLLPVSIRNLENQIAGKSQVILGKQIALRAKQSPIEVIKWYKSVLEKDSDYNKRSISIFADNNSADFQFAKPHSEKSFEVVGIPLEGKGLHIVELQSPRLGEFLLESQQPMFVATAVLVTNLAIHYKKARESSLVWVTELSSGEPVDAAEIAIFDQNDNLLGQGKTDKNGILKIASLNDPCSIDYGSDEKIDWEKRSDCNLYVFAKKNDDFSFISTAWGRGIEDYRFNLSREYLAPRWGPLVAHTIFDRPLLQVGEKIHMKHILREHYQNGFRAINRKTIPQRVLVTHIGSNKTFVLPFVYDSRSGTALSQFEVPKDAPLGTYSVRLSNKNNSDAQDTEGAEGGFLDWDAQNTGYFVVAEYKLPLIQSQLKFTSDNYVNPQSVNLDISAHYLSGGPAKDLPFQIRTQLAESSWSYFSEYEDFIFNSEPVQTGIKNSGSRESISTSPILHILNLSLDENGGRLVKLDKIPKLSKNSQLIVELEYQDPNGEIKTQSNSISLYPSAYQVGLKVNSWISSASDVSVEGVILDVNKNLVPDVAYEVEAFASTYISHRKRIVGGFYAFESYTQTKALGVICSGKSDAKGKFSCHTKTLPAGDVIIQARVKDNKGGISYSNQRMTLVDSKKEHWWVPGDSDRIDLIAEKKRYEPGEKARFNIRLPFEKAKTLITIEREGVLDAYVIDIKRDNPVFDIDLKYHYAPNIFVSALAVRGRVDEPKATATVDLARPSMKMGVAEIQVGWAGHKLDVRVETDKKKYTTKEKVRAKIKVSSAINEALAYPSEVAVVVIDKALLQLRANNSWNILNAMLGQRGLAVQTSTTLTQVIGRRHYGLKAQPTGGGGGQMAENPRQLFEALLYWNPNISLNRNGETEFEFLTNDSISEFHIQVIATAGLNYFGAGSTSIKTNKDIIIYSGMTPVVREGDRVDQVFSIRNTTDLVQDLTFNIFNQQGVVLPAARSFQLQPHSSQKVLVPMKIPLGSEDLDFKVDVKTKSNIVGDSLLVKVKRLPATPVQIWSSQFIALEKTTDLNLVKPSGALPARGGMEALLSSGISANLNSIKTYAADYPYTCYEQQISKAMAMDDMDLMDKLLSDLPNYLDNQGLIKFFPTSYCGSPLLTRYLIKSVQLANKEIPAELSAKITSGLSRFINLGQVCGQSTDKFFYPSSYRDQQKILMLEVLSDLGSFDVADIMSIKLTPQLWATETLIALERLMLKHSNIPDRENILSKLEQIFESRLVHQSGMIIYQHPKEAEGSYSYLFTHADEENISLFAREMQKNAEDKQRVAAFARGLIYRMRLGKWTTTKANAWGVQLFKKYKSNFENDVVTGNTVFSMLNEGQESRLHTVDWKSADHHDLFKSWQELGNMTEFNIKIDHQGQGVPWIVLQTKAAVPLDKPINMGFNISKKYIPVLKKNAKNWSVGDVVRVELQIESSTDQMWVALTDPIPAGASHISTGLAGADLAVQTAATEAETTNANDLPIEYSEKSYESFRAYSAFVPKGKYRLSYQIRLNSSGELIIPPTRIEAMYSPDVFAAYPNEVIKIEKN